MFRLLRSKKAQNTMEYAILIAVVVGAFSVMQLYMKRGLQARLKGGSDELANRVLSDVGAASGGNVMGILGDPNTRQYEPYYFRTGAMDMATTSSEGGSSGTASDTGGVTDASNRTTSRTGTREVTGTTNAD